MCRVKYRLGYLALNILMLLVTGWFQAVRASVGELSVDQRHTTFECMVPAVMPDYISENCQAFLVKREAYNSGEPDKIRLDICFIRGAGSNEKGLLIRSNSPEWPVWLCRKKGEWEDSLLNTPALSISIPDQKNTGLKNRQNSGFNGGDDYPDNTPFKKTGMVGIPLWFGTLSAGLLPGGLLNFAFNLELPENPASLPVIYEHGLLSDNSEILVITSGHTQKIYRRDSLFERWRLTGQVEAAVVSFSNGESGKETTKQQLRWALALAGAFGKEGKNHFPAYQLSGGGSGDSSNQQTSCGTQAGCSAAGPANPRGHGRLQSHQRGGGSGEDDGQEGFNPEKISAVLRSAECGVCFEVLTDPVFFYCGHSFCRSCAEKLLHDPGRSRCPICLAYVSRVQKNYQLMAVLEELKKLISSSSGDSSVALTVDQQIALTAFPEELATRIDLIFNLTPELLAKWSEGAPGARWKELVQKLFSAKTAELFIRRFSGKSKIEILLPIVTNSRYTLVKRLYDVLVQMGLVQEAEELLNAVLEHAIHTIQTIHVIEEQSKAAKHLANPAAKAKHFTPLPVMSSGEEKDLSRQELAAVLEELEQAISSSSGDLPPVMDSGGEKDLSCQSSLTSVPSNPSSEDYRFGSLIVPHSALRSLSQQKIGGDWITLAHSAGMNASEVIQIDEDTSNPLERVRVILDRLFTDRPKPEVALIKLLKQMGRKEVLDVIYERNPSFGKYLGK